MAEDGCINSGIFQNLDILGKVEFKDVSLQVILVLELLHQQIL